MASKAGSIIHELGPDPFDLRGHGAVVEHDVRGGHELLAAADVSRVQGEGVHDPELGHRERHASSPSTATVMRSRSSVSDALLEPLAGRVAGAQRLDAPEQRSHPREQVLDARAFGQVVVGAETQARHGVELALARRQER